MSLLFLQGVCLRPGVPSLPVASQVPGHMNAGWGGHVVPHPAQHRSACSASPVAGVPRVPCFPIFSYLFDFAPGVCKLWLNQHQQHREVLVRNVNIGAHPALLN